MVRFRVLIWSVCLALTALPAGLEAETAGQVILEVQGLPGGGDAAEARFTLEDLRALPAVSFQTSTIWTAAPQTFTGVPLGALLAHLGARGEAVRAVALNDYQVTIPMAALEDEAPIVAYLIDGETFAVREKGPLWIVFPYDAAPRYRTEETYAQSVWQLSRLVIERD